MILGITGITGSGKSYVCEFFKAKGFKIIDMDKIVHTLYETNQNCIDEITENFTCGILDENKKIDRKKLGDVVFNDKEKLNLLNKTVHKYVFIEATKEIEKHKNADIVLDCPILLKTPFEKMCDAKICVVCDMKKRTERIVKRDNIEENKAILRINSRGDENEIIKGCDYIIENNEGEESVIKQIDDIIKSIKENI